jgi:ketosteroid isomerase-like protein
MGRHVALQSARSRTAERRGRRFVPLQKEWETFEIVPSEYLVEEDAVLSIGRFRGVHGATGKSVDAAYAHLWTVRDGQITRFRQFIDTLAIAQAGR